MEDIVSHAEQDGRGSFSIERDGVRIGLMTYLRNDATHVTIDHTEVDPALRGGGVARRLPDAAVQWARQTNTRKYFQPMVAIPIGAESVSQTQVSIIEAHPRAIPLVRTWVGNISPIKTNSAGSSMLKMIRSLMN